MKAEEAAKKYCAGCAGAGNCRTPCTSVLMELWNEHDGKVTIPQMEEQMKIARRRIRNKKT